MFNTVRCFGAILCLKKRTHYPPLILPIALSVQLQHKPQCDANQMFTTRQSMCAMLGYDCLKAQPSASVYLVSNSLISRCALEEQMQPDEEEEKNLLINNRYPQQQKTKPLD